MRPAFLTVDDVVTIHRDQIERYGGAPGVRDTLLLQSAVAQPQATFEGNHLETDLFEMAAAYLFHIAKNHPFLDGNKRTAAVAALVFLFLNDIEVTVEEDSLVDVVIAATEGKAGKPEIGAFLKNASKPR